MPKYEAKPVCGCCWQAYSYGANDGVIVKPYTVREEHRPEKETCCFCGGFAEQGIYLRVDIDAVPFP